MWYNQAIECYLIIKKNEVLTHTTIKSLQMVTAAMKLKDTYSLEGNL